MGKSTKGTSIPVTVLDGDGMTLAGMGEIDVQEVQAWLGIKGIPRAVIVLVPKKESDCLVPTKQETRPQS